MNLKSISPQVVGPIIAAIFLALGFYLSGLFTNPCFVPNLEQPTAAFTAGIDPEYTVPDELWIIVKIRPDMDGKIPPYPYYVVPPKQVFDNEAVLACKTIKAADEQAAQLNKEHAAESQP